MLVAVVMILFVVMAAFMIDYGYVMTERTDLQRAADAAALAAVQDLIPADDGTQDTAAAAASVRSYVVDNLNENGFAVQDADIEIGRFDTTTIYSNVSLLNDGIKDAVRVTLRRDGSTNAMLPLFFAQAMGMSDAAVSASATAVLRKPSLLGPGSGVLPFAVPEDEWDDVDVGDTWTIYGDGKITDDDGDSVPGNWGTVDIGNSNNSTSDLRNQIENGLRQSDLDALYNDGRISSDTHIDTRDTIWLNADPGLSSGMKSAVAAVHGQTRVVPLFDQNNGKGGNNLEYRIVRWGVVTVTDSKFQGSKNSYVKVTKAYLYDGMLTPSNDLSVVESAIEGAFSTPVLVE